MGQFQVALVVFDESIAEHSSQTVNAGIHLRTPAIHSVEGSLRRGRFCASGIR